MAVQGDLSLLLAMCLVSLIPYVQGGGQCEAFHLKENSTKTVELNDVLSWRDSRCDLFSVSSEDEIFTLTGKQSASWPEDTFCMATSYPNAGETYQFEVDLWNHVGKGGDINIGHPGVAFNVQDDNNFDFLFFRGYINEYQFGYLQKGIVQYVKVGKLPSSLKGRTWFRVSLDLSGDEAVVFLNDKLLNRYVPRFDNVGNVAVLLANGFDNTVRFKDATVTGTTVVVKPMPIVGPRSCMIAPSKVGQFEVKSGKLAIDSEFVMTLTPEGAWARAMTKQYYQAFDNYWISVDIHPGDCSNWAGVLFNAEDIDNYEAVYFRCGVNQFDRHSFRDNVDKKGANIKLNSLFDASFPTKNTWYNVKIHIKGKVVDVYVDEMFVGWFYSYRSPGGHAGFKLWRDNTPGMQFQNFAIFVPDN